MHAHAELRILKQKSLRPVRSGVKDLFLFPCAAGTDGKQLFFVSEYGGIRWTDNEDGWGYGQGPKTKEEFLTRLKGLTDVLLDNKRMFAYCYTQLTDVEQEQNGLYTYDRKPKFDPAEIAPIFGKKAAVED